MIVTGIRILKSAGFSVLEEQEDGRITFELDISASDEKLLKGYKEALQQWMKHQDVVARSSVTEKQRGEQNH